MYLLASDVLDVLHRQQSSNIEASVNTTNISNSPLIISRLIRKNIPAPIILRNSIILPSGNIKTQILIPSHKPTGKLIRKLPLNPSKQIPRARIPPITPGQIERAVVRDTPLHAQDIDAVRPARAGDAVGVGAETARVVVEFVFHQADGDGVAVVVCFAFANEFADEEGIGGVGAVEGEPGEAEGGIFPWCPFVGTGCCQPCSMVVSLWESTHRI